MIMEFKREADKELVIRSLMMLTNGDKEFATVAVDSSTTYEDAIKFIFGKQGKLKDNK